MDAWESSRSNAAWCEVSRRMAHARQGHHGFSRALCALTLASFSGACAGTVGPGAPRDAAVDRAITVVDAPTADGPSNQGPVAMYREILRQIRVAACQRAQRCQYRRAPTFNLCMAGPERFEVEPDPPRLAMQLAGLERGELTLNPSALGACLDAISRSCERDFTVRDVAVPACVNFVRGSAAAGAPCVATEVCAPGLRCRITEGDGGTGCPGTCVPTVAGDSCSGTACGTLSCVFDRCVDTPLLPPREGDNRCGGNVTTPGYVTCPPGRVCTRGVEVNFYCQRPPCDPPCGPDAVCDYETRRCLDTELLGPGAACGSMGRVCDPRRGLQCDANRRCAPAVEAGGACRGADCAAGLTCIDSVCRRPSGTAADGAPCSFDGDCVSGACYLSSCRSAGCFR